MGFFENVNPRRTEELIVPGVALETHEVAVFFLQHLQPGTTGVVIPNPESRDSRANRLTLWGRTLEYIRNHSATGICIASWAWAINPNHLQRNGLG
jgi:hypothetical protein